MAGARMWAWRAHAYGAGAAELRLESARVPAVRAPDHVLVRVHAASLNPLDGAMLGGYGARLLNALRGSEGAAGEFPLVPGRDFVGEVARVGAGAKASRGARVWGVVPPHRPGAHAQYVLVRDRWVGPAPSSLSTLEAGGALYAALSACAVLRAAGVHPAQRPRPGTRVLLLGLGGVGQAALQLLVHSKAEVAVGCSRAAGDLAAELGARLALDPAAPDYGRALEEGGPYAAVVDCAGLGGGEAGARRWRFSRYATLTSPLLRLTDRAGLLLGGARAAAELAAQNAAAARLGPPPGDACAPRVRWAFFAPVAADVELLRRLAEAGALRVVVERAWGWWEAAGAFERQARGHARGKLLLDWTAARPRDSPTVGAAQRAEPEPNEPGSHTIR